MSRHSEKHPPNATRQDAVAPEARPYCPPELTEQIALQLGATLGFTDLSPALNIACDVRQAAWGAYRKAPEPRASSLPKELRKLLKATRKRGVDPSGIPTYLWPHLGVEDEAGIDELCTSRTDLTEAIEQAVETAQSDRETLLSQLGGRHRDPRIDAFVMALAQIYRQYMRHHKRGRPTVTFDPDTGNMVSHFPLFVDEAFCLFHPGRRPGPGAIQNAIKETVRFEREIEPMSDDELDNLIPRADTA